MEGLPNIELLRLDAFLLRSCELEPDIDSEMLAERVWYSLGIFCNSDDVLDRLAVYFYEDDNHFSLN
jgi:hypothetical protein